MTKDKHTSQPPEVVDPKTNTAESLLKSNPVPWDQDLDILSATLRKISKSQPEEN
ncbi:MAG: hypothetical protein JKY82_03000 [Rhizobiaceae bacterium]|nr:hypothetical protein [Rhizobiaceae bacterium]